MPDISKIINAIPAMGDEQLLNLFKNAVGKLSDGTNDSARDVVAAIAHEWKQRLERAVAGGVLTARPTKGMLHELGYKVGQEGERTPIRRQILKQVVEMDLPLVSSPAYTNEWGTPGSQQRFRKLTRFLEERLSNPAYRDMDKALIEWSEDLEWVRQTYPQFHS